MCTTTNYTLVCMHVVTGTLYCDKAKTSSKGPHRKKPCSRLRTTSVPWPPPPETGLSTACPLPDCPFEACGGQWNCCYCGKAWNDTGVCAAVHISDGILYPCGHVCCANCGPAEPLEGVPDMPWG